MKSIIFEREIENSEEVEEVKEKLLLSLGIDGQRVIVRIVLEDEEHFCWFSGCKEISKDVKEFNSYEEGSVWLCEKHMKRAIEEKTGVQA